MKIITRSTIRNALPNIHDALLDALWDRAQDFQAIGVTTGRRFAGLFGTIHVETGGGRAIEENFRYTRAEGLVNAFGVFSRGELDPRLYVYNANKPYEPQARRLANAVYANRIDLGNRGGDDGWNFRGSGPIQTTGRYNFGKAAERLGIDCLNHPDILRNVAYAGHIAALEWKTRDLNALCDAGDLLKVREGINGRKKNGKPPNGYAEFRTQFARILRLVGDGPIGWPVQGTTGPMADAAPEPAKVEVAITADDRSAAALDAVAQALKDHATETAYTGLQDAPARLPDVSSGPALTPVVPQPAQPAGVIDPEAVRTVQQLLWDKGYKVVGRADGLMGKRTRAAIAAFRADKGMGPGTEITPDLKAALIDAPKVDPAPQRIQASSKTIGQLVPEAAAAAKAKLTNAIGTVTTAVGGLVTWAFSDDGQEKIQGVNDKARGFASMVGLNTGLTLLVVAVAICGTGWFFSQRAQKKAVEAYRNGERN